MQIVAGLSLKNLKPRVWDRESAYHVPGVNAVMVSYAELHGMDVRRRRIMDIGLHEYLSVPKTTKVYLDNGAFYFLTREGRMPRKAYEQFVSAAKPDWYPIPQEYIPHPAMELRQQRDCYRKTMRVNRAYDHDGFVPVVHVGRMLPRYVEGMSRHKTLKRRKRVALGGIVPNLLRAPKALPYREILDSLTSARATLKGKNLHVFGMGGTATIHLAALLGFDSVDSSGWRNRAARGIVQLPGSGDRMVANLGNWRGREPSKEEWDRLRRCSCRACRSRGIKGLKARGIDGFSHRASHNLSVLLSEAEWVAARLAAGTYARTYRRRLNNTVYSPIIRAVVEARLAVATM